jgi:hypothetical protein
MLSYPFKHGLYYLSERYLFRGRTSKSSIHSTTDGKDSTILAWFQDSFHLDFSRNNIFTIAEPGMVAGAGHPVSNLKYAKWLQGHLQNMGVRYVIWGYREPPKAQYGGTDELEDGLAALAKHSRIVYNDGIRVMMDINGCSPVNQ